MDEHYHRRKQNVLKEAKIWFESYKDRYGHYPPESKAGPFFPLFTNRETFDYENDKRLFCNGDNMEEVKADFRKGTPLFESYEEFIEYLKNDN